MVQAVITPKVKGAPCWAMPGSWQDSSPTRQPQGNCVSARWVGGALPVSTASSLPLGHLCPLLAESGGLPRSPLRDPTQQRALEAVPGCPALHKPQTHRARATPIPPLQADASHTRCWQVGGGGEHPRLSHSPLSRLSPRAPPPQSVGTSPPTAPGRRAGLCTLAPHTRFRPPPWPRNPGRPGQALAPSPWTALGIPGPMRGLGLDLPPGLALPSLGGRGPEGCQQGTPGGDTHAG